MVNCHQMLPICHQLWISTQSFHFFHQISIDLRNRSCFFQESLRREQRRLRREQSRWRLGETIIFYHFLVDWFKPGGLLMEDYGDETGKAWKSHHQKIPFFLCFDRALFLQKIFHCVFCDVIIGRVASHETWPVVVAAMAYDSVKW